MKTPPLLKQEDAMKMLIKMMEDKIEKTKRKRV